MLRAFLLAAAVLVAPSATLADKADADACAARLKGQSKVLYRASLPYVLRGDTLENAMTKATKPRVDSGRLSENEARRYARQAADCVRLVHRKG